MKTKPQRSHPSPLRVGEETPLADVLAGYDPGWLPPRIRLYAQRAGHRVTVSRDSPGGPIRGAIFYRVRDGIATIDLLAVAEAYRRQGTGSDLLAKVFTLAKSVTRIEVVVEEVDLDALAFFKGCNFESDTPLKGHFGETDGIVLFKTRNRPQTTAH